jgi:hypothetical protein
MMKRFKSPLSKMKVLVMALVIAVSFASSPFMLATQQPLNIISPLLDDFPPDDDDLR